MNSEGIQFRGEERSNQMLIGVIANDDLIAQAMLRLLRSLIDWGSLNFIYDDLYDEMTLDTRGDTFPELSVNEIVRYLASQESTYHGSFLFTEPLTATLWIRGGGRKELVRNIYEVDLYTLARLNTEVEF